MSTATTSSIETPTTEPRRRRGPVPGSEAARRGGLAASAKLSRDFYATIGRKGGNVTQAKLGSQFYSAIGQKGGQATLARHGVEHFQRAGRKGGKVGHRRGGPRADDE